MPQRELEGWREFYVLYPFDDRHRYHKPAAAVMAVLGGKYDERIEFLSPTPKPVGLSEADANTLLAFGIKPHMRPH